MHMQLRTRPQHTQRVVRRELQASDRRDEAMNWLRMPGRRSRALAWTNAQTRAVLQMGRSRGEAGVRHRLQGLSGHPFASPGMRGVEADRFERCTHVVRDLVERLPADWFAGSEISSAPGRHEKASDRGDGRGGLASDMQDRRRWPVPADRGRNGHEAVRWPTGGRLPPGYFHEDARAWRTQSCSLADARRSCG